MEDNKFISKKVLIYICVVIFVIIVIRILYELFNKNGNSLKQFIEGFDSGNGENNNTNNTNNDGNTGSALDLLSKLKSHDVYSNNSNNKGLVKIDTTDLESQIYIWSNRLVNMQNQQTTISTQSKPIAFYKPKLNINNSKYCKLGDIVSQSKDYNLPNDKEVVLLVNKNSSDIKSPSSFELVVDINIPNFDNSNYINAQYSSDIPIDSKTISSISNSLATCSLAFINLNAIIQGNMQTITSKFTSMIYDNSPILIGNTNITISELIKKTSSNGKDLFSDIKSEEFSDVSSIDYKGCWKDTGDRAVPIEVRRINTIDDCYQQAIQLGYNTFSLQNKKHCFVGNDPKFDKYGQGSSDKCANPLGEVWTNQVYNVEKLPYTYKGCYFDEDGSGRTLKNRLGTDKVSSIKECYNRAKEKGYDIFALQNGGECWADKQSESEFNKYGTSADDTCSEKGGNFRNKVYTINPRIPLHPLQPLNNAYYNINLDANSKDTDNTNLTLPIGIIGDIIDYNNTIYNLNFVSSIQDTKKTKLKLLNDIKALSLFKNVELKHINDIITSSLLCNLLPVLSIVNYIKDLCSNIKIIYDTQNNNTDLLTYLKLAPNKNCVISILDIMNSFSDATNPSNSNITFKTIIDKINKDNDNIKEDRITLLGMVIYIMTTINIDYTMIYLEMPLSTLGIHNIQSISLKQYNNPIMDYVSKVSTDISNKFNPYNATINNILPKINSMSLFITALNSKIISDFPLQIYKPIAPDGYSSLGHIFCNTKEDLQKIIDSKNVACIPSHCVKEMRDWVANDKIYEYNKNGKYWAIYLNPYIGTFISTNISAQILPEGKVCKVVACVKKCSAVDDLEKADDCTRKYYNMNKKLTTDTSITPNLVSNQEEIFYLDKLKTQSDSIAQLKSRAQNMQIDIDKATIVNREMNKNKLQTYVDTQKQNIDMVMNKLQSDKNKIQTNVNIPPETLAELKTLVNNSNDMTVAQKKIIVSKIIDNQLKMNQLKMSNNKSLTHLCPQYDVSGLVKKSLVSDVCYGCDM